MGQMRNACPSAELLELMEKKTPAHGQGLKPVCCHSFRARAQGGEARRLSPDSIVYSISREQNINYCQKRNLSVSPNTPLICGEFS